MSDRDIIVFPTDFSSASLGALSWATRMAAIWDAEVHVVYAVEVPHIYGTLDVGPIPVPTAEELAISAQARMDNFVQENLASQNQPAVGKILVGRPSEEIVRYANETGAKMIVMTTHGHTGVRHVILGSTTEAVLRHSDCPVLSVRSE